MTHKEIRDEARAILSSTIATEAGRTFPTRAEFRRCLDLLARLSEEAKWDFLRLDNRAGPS